MLIDNVVPLVKLGDGCSYYRIHLPFIHMGMDFEKAKKKPLEEHFSTARIVNWSREPGIKIETLLLKQKEHSFKLIMDVDDDIFSISVKSEFYSPYTSHWQELMKVLIKKSDIITCTTDRLRDRLLKLNENVVVIPNALPIGLDQYSLPTRTEDEPVRFIYASGATHFWDLRSIAPVFSHFNNLHFSLAGYNNPTNSNNNPWSKMERICSNNYNNPNYQRLPTKDLFSYMTHFDNANVAIAPLEDTYFNAGKSSLKAYEAGAKKCAFICSAVPPYTDDLPDDVVTFCKSVKDWKVAIKKHQNIEYATEQGEKLYQWVKENRNLETINQLRINLFKQL